jgi:hypothetical protein
MATKQKAYRVTDGVHYRLTAQPFRIVEELPPTPESFGFWDFVSGVIGLALLGFLGLLALGFIGKLLGYH